MICAKARYKNDLRLQEATVKVFVEGRKMAQCKILGQKSHWKFCRAAFIYVYGVLAQNCSQ